jgi:hypothetical protein
MFGYDKNRDKYDLSIVRLFMHFMEKTYKNLKQGENPALRLYFTSVLEVSIALLFYPEEEGSSFFRNTGDDPPDYTV